MIQKGAAERVDSLLHSRLPRAQQSRLVPAGGRFLTPRRQQRALDRGQNSGFLEALA